MQTNTNGKLFGIKDKLERKHQVLSNSNKIKRLKKQTKIPSKKKFKPKLKKNLAQTAIDTVGRNKDGELNILGVLLVLFIILKLKGIIGKFDNTKPGPNPENLDQWINVTLPTTAIFRTTEESEHKKITSPAYHVTNHSALSVRASVSNVTEVKEMSEVDRLMINTIELFKDGVSTVAATPLFTLSGNEGNHTVGNFRFSGDAAPKNASVESNPSFKLVLNFAVEE
ncbi:hypothetical protein [Enterococcus mundtii]|uniref:hypothetical protein n=1 Tax=Enterococcus mundtii TaxID=53346 RepID=UPI00403D4E35